MIKVYYTRYTLCQRALQPRPERPRIVAWAIINRNGISTLRFDQPNCGNSQEDFLDSSYKEWVNTIVFFANKYLDKGYKVALLGQSMGAAATVIATSKFKGKIPCMLLWVPGVNEGDFNGNAEEIFEEGGQKYKGKFWLEA